MVFQSKTGSGFCRWGHGRPEMMSPFYSLTPIVCKCSINIFFLPHVWIGIKFVFGAEFHGFFVFCFYFILDSLSLHISTNPGRHFLVLKCVVWAVICVHVTLGLAGGWSWEKKKNIKRCCKIILFHVCACAPVNQLRWKFAHLLGSSMEWSVSILVFGCDGVWYLWSRDISHRKLLWQLQHFLAEHFLPSELLFIY